MERTLYEILGVLPTATDEEIRKGYKRRALECHPDKTNGAETEEFYAVNLAYTILMNHQKRIAYDKTGDPSDTLVDNARVDAMKELQRVILSFLNEDEDDSIFYKDLLIEIAELFNLNILERKNTIVDLKKEMRKLRRFKKRFQYKKNDANDFVGTGISRSIYGVSESITEEIAKIRQFELMLELLTSYEYTPEWKPSEPGRRSSLDLY